MDFKKLSDYDLDYFKNQYYQHNNNAFGLFTFYTAIEYDSIARTETFLVEEYDGCDYGATIPYKYETPKILGSRLIDILNLDIKVIESVLDSLLEIVLIRDKDTNSLFNNVEGWLLFDETQFKLITTQEHLERIPIIDVTIIKSNIAILHTINKKLLDLDICFYGFVGVIDDTIVDFESVLEEEEHFASAWERAVLDYVSIIHDISKLKGNIKKFKRVVPFCLGREYIETSSSGSSFNLATYSTLKRFYIYCCVFDEIMLFRPWKSNTTFNKEIVRKRIALSEDRSESLIRILETFSDVEISLIDSIDISGDFYDFFFSSFINMVRHNILVATCKSCGKLFIPNNRSDEIYCNNIFKRGKTCRDLGYDDRIASDESLKVYRTAYKTQNAKKQRNRHIPDVEDRFHKWLMEAKNKLADTQGGELELEDFKKWLKDDWWLH